MKKKAKKLRVGRAYRGLIHGKGESCVFSVSQVIFGATMRDIMDCYVSFNCQLFAIVNANERTPARIETPHMSRTADGLNEWKAFILCDSEATAKKVIGRFRRKYWVFADSVNPNGRVK